MSWFQTGSMNLPKLSWVLCSVIKKKKKTFKTHLKKTLFTHVSNPWWWPMKGPKALGTILVNSSTQFETKALIRKLERILIKLYRQNVSLLFNQTCLNIIYIYPTTLPWVGCDTRLILSEVQQVWIQSFSFSHIGCHTNVREPSLPYYLSIAGRRVIGCISD